VPTAETNIAMNAMPPLYARRVKRPVCGWLHHIHYKNVIVIDNKNSAATLVQRPWQWR
jgi:hypothetical protein